MLTELDKSILLFSKLKIYQNINYIVCAFGTVSRSPTATIFSSTFTKDQKEKKKKKKKGSII